MNEICPAGIDIPTYLALIAQGKDPQAIIEGEKDFPKVIEAARTSLRLVAEHVTIAYIRTREQMPADVE